MLFTVYEVTQERVYPINPYFKVMHHHKEVQLIYVNKGSIDIKTLDTTIHLNQGEGIFLNEDNVHFINPLENSHHYTFLFNASETITNVLLDKIHVPYYFLSPTMLVNLLSLIQLKKDTYYELEGILLLTRIFIDLSKTVENIPVESHILEDRIRIFLSYIEQHYSEDITLEDLASSAHLSKSECLRCFKSALTTTPYQYLLEYRLSIASELLLNSDDTITQISQKVGFNQVSHFGKLFKEKTQMTPKAYRNYYRKKDIS
ncbi:MAG: helix-turn-helix transcriptional regulator [Erysipelotrichaceae bacterium]|nr:helix-turn-helix transcriptional regulator [Erysipelotrichaceae bacterium]